jgi:tripartite-type tricarboxylate transporter receptor subunit TctC
MEQSGTGFVVTLIFGVAAPAGTPPEIVAKLNSAINDGLRSREVQNSVARFGAEAKPDSPENFRRFIEAELKRWAEVAKTAKIELD